MMYQDAMYSAMEPSRSDESWDNFTESLHGSLVRLEEIIDDVAEVSAVCTDEWCEAANCMLDEATVAAFAISEPHWASEEDSRKLKELKKRLHDLHVDRSHQASPASSFLAS